MNSVPQMLQLAVQYHQAGNLYQAELLYQQILRIDPRHADALHLIGLIAHQVGKHDLAVKYITQALHVNPMYFEAYNNLGIVLREQGKPGEAVTNFRQSLHLKPDYAEAFNNLGLALQDQGMLEEAIAKYQQALRLKPDLAEAYNNLGNVLKEQGKLEEAITHYRQSLRLNPDYVLAHNNLGVALQGQEKFAEAISSYQQALRLQPGFAEVYCNLGNALKKQGKLEEAISQYRQALRLKPDHPLVHFNLGFALQEQGKLDEAIIHYQQTLVLKPDHAEACSNLGLALKEQGKIDEAVAHFQQALRLKADYAPAYNNLGNICQEQGRLDEAVTHYRHALELKPDFVEVYNNLGSTLQEQGKLTEAISNRRQALRLRPDDAAAHSNLVFCLQYHPDFDSIALYQESRRWNDQHAQGLAKFIQLHANHPDPDRRLRIGYVSSNFRDHCQSFFTIPLLSNHDHRQGEIYCYSDVARPDAVTLRERGYPDVWRNILGISDQQVAELIRNDQIDILVDLTMHMAKNRLLVFARKPAPVQVAWLAYPGTTGLSTMDYRLSDPYLDPPGENDTCYCEQTIRLPNTFWCYDPLSDQPLVNDLPASASGFITFGCLNHFCKVNDGVLMLWAKTLRAVRQSRLLLLAPRGQARDHVLAILKEQGIDESRVDFALRQPFPQYLQQYHRVDLGLDPLPYNGHTTSLDAFWMGVPTITLIGKTVVGRAGWSQLCNLGLPELAAQTPEDFVKIAVQLAGDLPRLQKLRASMRERMRASPLMDGKLFASQVEQAYRQMWRTWCQKRVSP